MHKTHAIGTPYLLMDLRTDGRTEVTSHEQRLITKEHIATHTNLIFWLYTQVIKLFISSIKLH